jgi:glycosyltransferase involved in cell wall biosynthesis
MTESVGKRKLKILFFSQRFLYPLDTGGKIRTGKLLEKLNAVFDITLISNVESPKDDVYLKNIHRLCSKFHPVPWKEIKKYTWRFYLRLLLRMFSRYPVTVLNDYSKDLETAILRVVENDKYDLLICDFAQSGLNFRKVRGYPLLLFQHNVESMIPLRHFQAVRDPVSKLFWWLQWIKMARFERRMCQRATAIVAVSDADKQVLEARFSARNVNSIPTGVDVDYYSPRESQPVDDNSIVFVGAMDWLPNEDAILFFLREIYGKIKTQITSLKFTIVGRNPSAGLLSVLRQYPDVFATGWVEDVRPFVAEHAVCVLPLRIGGGTRIKVYEAMAMGKAVISTRIGVEGLPVTNGKNVVVVEEGREFANAVVQLLGDAELRTSIGNSARRFVERHASWSIVAERFAGICQRIVKTCSEME